MRHFFPLVVLILGTTLTFAQDYRRVISFGDSHSDNGNSLPVYGFVQPAPHVNGRLSNGILWNERLSSTINNYQGVYGSMDRIGLVAMSNAPVNNNVNVNYAISGYSTQGMASQIDRFSMNGGVYNARDLLTVSYGGNDVTGAISGGATQATIGGFMNTAVTTMRGQMQRQITQGGLNFLVFNLHDRGDAPFFAGGVNEATARQGTLDFNTSFRTQMSQLAASNLAANIIQFDMYSLQKAIQNNPAAFGFLSSTQTCLSVAGCSTASLAIQNQYFRWDNLHYTDAGHAIIAKAAAITLNYGKDAARSSILTDTAMVTRLGNLNRAHDKITAFRNQYKEIGKTEVSLEAIGELRSTIGSDSQAAIMGAQFSLRKSITENVSAGVNLTLQVGEIKQGNISFETTQMSIDGFASLDMGSYFLSGVVGFTNSNYSNWKRNHGFGDLVNTAETGGKTVSASLEFGKKIVTHGFVFTPLMRLSGLSTALAGFTEEGTLAPIVVSGRNSTLVVGAVEARIDHEIGAVNIHGLLGYQAIVASNGNEVTGNLANNSSQAQTMRVSTAQIDGAYLGAGVHRRFTKSASMGIDYRANFTSEAQHKVYGGVKLGF